ncbi:UPF0669 protein C6orf120 homolog isoform X2 [Bombyx mandarina]|uniref:UPF0669 protein C6orf120 homolog isoform X2 n=1 Tax=Bombyx mandarina TaxID=7092 RepID=A0A6J2K6D9_BOMMA|nr:UPF0669 protein C6orf120 homolog isoform X2 [Bombyx mandarina]
MRRKFIIILLGIICASTLSSLFSALPERQPNKLLLNVASGIVGAGNFTYWHLGYTGPLSIELRSLSGDADLYVAYHMRPGYEVFENEYSSTTCGLDVVYIPDDYLRPIGVGIFGHWAYEQSEYKIRVYQDNTPVIYPRVMAGEETSYKPNEYPEGDAKRERRDNDRKTEDENKSRFIIPLLNILDTLMDFVFL